jgi:type IV pilus assembly protein PilZ
MENNNNNIVGPNIALNSNKVFFNANIQDKRELYRSYMPFIKNGGLFFQFNNDVTPARISLGQNIFVVLTLMDSNKKYTVNGRVIWITRGSMIKGYGISLGEGIPMRSLKEHIEHLVLDFSIKKEATYTL